ncbi:helix-turn-helix domain-containing protein [Anaerorhabdus sp.]|uniref:helix-turn-helix domain-containing protein n=1 Tax=Anaerorhabdus sp. TaxID=1872524 RepID=UPI002FCBA4BC
MRTTYTSKYIIKKDFLSNQLKSFDIEPLFFSFYSKPMEKPFENDILTHFKISIVTKGIVRIKSKSYEYIVEPYDCVVFPPNMLYSIQPIENEEIEFYTIYFDLPKVQKNNFIHLFQLQTILCLKQFFTDHSLYYVAEKYREHCLNEQMTYQSVKLLLDQTFLKILKYIQLEGYQPFISSHYDTEEKVVSSCIQYIDNHSNDLITVQDLCTHLSLSQSYLYRCFMNYLHESPKKFIVQYQLKRTEADLMHSTKSISEIANQFGFSSVYSFCNIFKANYHMSPKTFRNQFRKDILQ